MGWWDRLVAAARPAPPPQRPAHDLPTWARSFKGATTSHLQQHWNTTNSGINTLISARGNTLRARARDLVRNNAHAARAVTALVTRIVGCGILPHCSTGDSTIDAMVDAHWSEWARQSSATDDLTIYGQQALAVRGMIESGETIVRFRPRRIGDVSAGRVLRVPFQVEVLEADQLDHWKTEATDTGGKIIQGVEFDAIGRRRGYWIYPDHPYETLVTSTVRNQWLSAFVPADSTAHLYQAVRPGQVRGFPWLAPIMVTLRDLDEAQDYELVRMRMASALVAFVSGDESGVEQAIGAPEQGDDPNNPSTITDVNGNPLERVEPGMVGILRGSRTVTLSNPTAVGGFPEYVKSQLKRISAGIGVPYPSLAADLEGVNYSSYRAGNLEHKAMVEAIQEHLVIPLLCDPLWRAFIRYAIAAGLIPDRAYPVEWSPPRFEDVDRVKEALADRLEIRSGTASRQGIVRRRGYDPDQVLAEIAQDNAKADEIGAVFDSDPRKTSSSGTAQDYLREREGIETGAAPSELAADERAALRHLLAEAEAEGDTEAVAIYRRALDRRQPSAALSQPAI